MGTQVKGSGDTAQPIVTESETNPQSNVIKNVKNPPILYILESIVTLYHDMTTAGFTDGQARRYVSKYVKNLVSPNGIDIALFLWEHGATTKPELVSTLQMNRQTVNRIIEELHAKGLTVKRGVVRKPYANPRGGPHVDIYALVDSLPEKVNDAQRRYAELTQALINVSLEQDIIDSVALQFKDREGVDGKEIMKGLRVQGVTGPKIKQYMTAVTRSLSEKGVKVWK